MQLIIERNALLKVLRHVSGIVERRNTIPILSNVLLTAGDNTLHLTTTDLDIEVVEQAACDVITPGSTTVLAQVLHDISRKLPDGAQVKFSQTDGMISISAGRAKFDLQALQPEEYPDIGSVELDHRFTMPAKELRSLIESNRFAISTEETRYYLNGIYLHVFEDRLLRAVATDGHRLALSETALPEGVGNMPGVIVPRKTVNELYRLLDDAQQDVDIEVSTEKIRFTIGSMVITSKLISGTFPDYSRVIPDGNDKTLAVDTELFRHAAERVSTLSQDKGRAIKFTIGQDSLQLSVNSPENGHAEEEIAATYSGTPMEIGFSSRYIADIMAQLKNPMMKILLSDPGSPIIVRDGDNEASLYVLMPMRV